MKAVVWRAVVTSTIVAGAIGAARQRHEASATRRGELAPASAAADVAPRTTYGRLARRLSVWVPDPPRTPVGRYAASAWAGPLTVVGVALALVAGKRPQWRSELQCFVASDVGGPSGLALRAVGAHANTIGQIVIATQSAPSPVLLAHEATHVRQAERLGPLLFPVYVWLSARYGYRDNPLEHAARTGARRFRDQVPDLASDGSSSTTTRGISSVSGPSGPTASSG